MEIRHLSFNTDKMSDFQ